MFMATENYSQMEDVMSSKEYEKVKDALSRLMLAYCQECANSLAEFIFLRDKEKKESDRWWRYNLRATAVFQEFTETVDIIYPGNETQMRNWVSVLDEMEVDCKNIRIDADDYR